MNEKEIKALAGELSKSLKTPEDLNELCAVLKKVSIEVALGAELSDHPGYDNGSPRAGTNSRNVYSKKNGTHR